MDDPAVILGRLGPEPLAKAFTAQRLGAGLARRRRLLKPLLLGRGVQVPMLVIFVGAIGGFITSGIIGLFTGAVVLTLGYMLFMTWLHGKTAQTPEQDTQSAAAGQ